MAQPFRIFVSSTWTDLKPERLAVENALHRMGDAEFSGMEYFGSRPETPREVSLAEVEQSEVYVGIFAQRYGSGITEDEYRTARVYDIPCLIYLKDPALPLPTSHIEQDAAKAACLEALIAELKASHTVTWFKSPDELSTQVVADLHNFRIKLCGQQEQESSEPAKYQFNIGLAQGCAFGDHAKVIRGSGASSDSIVGDPEEPKPPSGRRS